MNFLLSTSGRLCSASRRTAVASGAAAAAVAALFAPVRAASLASKASRSLDPLRDTRWPNDPPSLVSNEAANATLTIEVPTLDSATKILILNKADTSKNALRAETIRDVTLLLRKWNRDTVTTSVVLRPNSLASLSAGIDFSIVRERDAVERVVDVIGAMGSLAHVLGAMGTASFVLAPGIVAGAGASLLHAGTCRAVAKQTKFSQPEVSFGLVPFGGASYWLAQLDEPHVAAYVALTGAPLRAGDLVASGIATHELLDEAFAAHERSSLGWAVASVYVANAERFVERAKRCEIDDPTLPALFERHGDALKKAFSHDSVPAIVDALKQIKGDSKDWAQRSARLIEQHCPLATAAALRLLRELRARDLSFADALRVEYRVASRLAMREHGLAGIEARFARRADFRWPTASLSGDALRGAVDALFVPAPADASDSRALAALDREAAVVAWDARADLTRSSAVVMNAPLSTNTSWRRAFEIALESDRELDVAVSEKLRRGFKVFSQTPEMQQIFKERGGANWDRFIEKNLKDRDDLAPVDRL